MKHPTNRAYFAYWESKRGEAPAPERNRIDPSEIRHLAADNFVLDVTPESGFPLRSAGTRVKALLGDLGQQPFSQLFARGDRAEIQTILALVSAESQPVVMGITATAAFGTEVPLELLLLPFASRPHAPRSIGGSMAAFGDVPGHSVSDLRAGSCRFLPVPAVSPSRTLRKLKVAHGLTVYEGLRAAS